MDFLTIFLGFVLGAIVGSFLNVLALRYGTGRSLGGRSACMSCGQTLGWRELIPVFSFFFQRGRCGHCKSAISRQYPLVEAVTGLAFASVFYKELPLLYDVSLASLFAICYLLLIWSVLIPIAAYDLRHKIIPNGLVWTFAGVSFLKIFAASGGIPSLWTILAGPAIALPFALIWLFSGGRAMGLGDAKLSLGVGWMLGLGQGLSALLISFWIGAAVSVILLLSGRGRFTMKSEIPFAPFLIIAAFVTYMFRFDFLGLTALL